MLQVGTLGAIFPIFTEFVVRKLVSQEGVSQKLVSGEKPVSREVVLPGK